MHVTMATCFYHLIGAGNDAININLSTIAAQHFSREADVSAPFLGVGHVASYHCACDTIGSAFDVGYRLFNLLFHKNLDSRLPEHIHQILAAQRQLGEVDAHGHALAVFVEVAQREQQKAFGHRLLVSVEYSEIGVA